MRRRPFAERSPEAPAQSADLRRRSAGQHGVSARRRLIVAAVVGALAAGAAAALGPWDFAPLLGWDTTAVVLVVWIWLGIARLDGDQTAARAEREDPSAAPTDLLLLSAAVASLLAVGLVLVLGSSTKSPGIVSRVALGVGSVVLSWALVHTIYTLRYARLYYSGEDGGVDFHGRGRPRYLDFAYLSFTVGMTFQVSDTDVQDDAIRHTVLRHALLSYLFGAVIVAGTINLVAGLTK
jgi:uncharacterized membrane protein